MVKVSGIIFVMALGQSFAVLSSDLEYGGTPTNANAAELIVDSVDYERFSVPSVSPGVRNALKKRRKPLRDSILSLPTCPAPRSARQRLQPEQRNELREEIRAEWSASKSQLESQSQMSRKQRSKNQLAPQNVFPWELPRQQTNPQTNYLPPLTSDEKFNFKADVIRVQKLAK